MRIIKRNGSEAAFDISKIISAITRANDTVDESIRLTAAQIREIADNVVAHCEELGRSPNVEEVQDMVRDAAKSFVERDGDLAKAVCRADDAVDDLFEVIRKKLTGIVHRDIEGDDNGEQALDMLMVAKYLEKIGDHASNIAEWVIFMITGEHKKLN